MIPIETQNAPAAIGPYSQAIEAGGAIYVSGQLPVNPQTGTMPEDIREAAGQSLTNLQNILEQAGSSLSQVVKVTIFLTDLGNFNSVNEVYQSFFTAPYPARSCIEVAALPKGAPIEIECIAGK